MTERTYFLGIDGGGSQTRAQLADSEGRMLGNGSAGPSNYQAIGFEAATNALLSAIEQAFEQANLPKGTPIQAACFGLAGIGRPADRARFEAWAREQALAQHTLFVSDAELLLAAGTPEGWGVALIAGTGSFCWGRDAHGRTARVGGWGYLLGDEGSGYDLAVRALRLATQTADGRATAHRLLEKVLDHWQLSSAAELVPFVYRPECSRADIASLCTPILALVSEGDPHATALLEQSATELARMVTTLIAALEMQQPPIALAGGLLGGSSELRAALLSKIGDLIGPQAYVDTPVRGAVVLAQRSQQPQSA
jgi:N-acetylglucosamine kinase-like BadF-type ATPase